MSTLTPASVTNALQNLNAEDKSTVERYIELLQQGRGDEFEAEEEEEIVNSVEEIEEEEEEEEKMPEGATMVKDSPDTFPAMYKSGDDGEKAANFKMEASDAKATGDYEKAVQKYTEAICASQPSAMTYSGRADCLLKLKRPCAAIRDCDEALKINPDSAKALRVRGRARRAIGDWESARKDLSASQAIDFDETAMVDLKFVTEKVAEIDKKRVEARLVDEAAKQKRAAEIRRANEEAKARAEEESTSNSMPNMSGGMPGMGGMPGIPAGMGEIFKDPEMMAAMQNPKVMKALQGMMSGGMPDMAKITQLMSDPEVGPVLQKLMGKFAGGMGGMPGMGGVGGMPGMGGMGGMPGMGGNTGGFGGTSSGADDFDDMPDLD